MGSNQKNAMTPMATVNTDNILFICGGAFPDLEDIIKERLRKKSSMGFGAVLKDRFDEDPDILSHVTNEDLRAFGMIPEFLGRLPVTVTLQGLTQEMLVRVLKEPKNAIIKQYEKLLAMDEVKLVFEDEALSWIAGEALKRGPAPGPCGPFWRSLCWTSCMRFPRIPTSDPWWLPGLTWRSTAAP